MNRLSNFRRKQTLKHTYKVLRDVFGATAYNGSAAATSDDGYLY